MSKHIIITPGPGLKIRHPVTRKLYGEGDVFEIDPSDLFWFRLLLDEDVVPVEPQAKSED